LVDEAAPLEHCSYELCAKKRLLSCFARPKEAAHHADVGERPADERLGIGEHSDLLPLAAADLKVYVPVGFDASAHAGNGRAPRGQLLPTALQFMKRFCWKTDAGLVRMQGMLQESGHKMAAPGDAGTWWHEHVKSAASKIPVQCKTCAVVKECLVGNVASGHRPVCKCGIGSRGNITPWASEDGKRRAFEIARSKSMEYIDSVEWSNVTARTKLSWRCTDCGISGMMSLNQLSTEHKMSCFCNRGILYSSEAARVRICEVAARKNLTATGCLMSPSDWRAFNANRHSEAEFTCNSCLVTVPININRLLNTASCGNCGCTKKTQLIVFKHLLQLSLLNGTASVRWEYRMSNIATMPFDIAILSAAGTPLVFVEVDGQQHFAWHPHRHFEQADVERTMKNDLIKERCAVAAHVSVVRLVQEDVWNNRFDWKSWLHSVLDRALVDAPAVVVQDSPLYHAGAYACMRV
jgi:hypothetical protein